MLMEEPCRALHYAALAAPSPHIAALPGIFGFASLYIPLVTNSFSLEKIVLATTLYLAYLITGYSVYHSVSRTLKMLGRKPPNPLLLLAPPLYAVLAIHMVKASLSLVGEKKRTPLTPAVLAFSALTLGLHAALSCYTAATILNAAIREVLATEAQCRKRGQQSPQASQG